MKSQTINVLVVRNQITYLYRHLHAVIIQIDKVFKNLGNEEINTHTHRKVIKTNMPQL